MPFEPIPDDNPAGRLHNVMSEINEVVRNGQIKGVDVPSQYTSQSKLSVIFGIPDGDTSLLFARMSDLTGLPSQIRNAISSTPAVPQGFAEFLPGIETYLNNIVNTFGQSGLPLSTDEQLVALKLCSALLSQHSPEPVIDSDVLESIKAELYELIDLLGKVDIDDDLRRFIWSYLLELINAVERYKLLGVKPVKDALNAFVGASRLQTFDSEDSATPEDREARKNFESRFWTVMDRLASSFGVFNMATQITMPFVYALTTGHHIG
jgi:hypothetical protein